MCLSVKISYTGWFCANIIVSSFNPTGQSRVWIPNFHSLFTKCHSLMSLSVAALFTYCHFLSHSVLLIWFKIQDTIHLQLLHSQYKCSAMMKKMQCNPCIHIYIYLTLFFTHLSLFRDEFLFTSSTRALYLVLIL